MEELKNVLISRVWLASVIRRLGAGGAVTRRFLMKMAADSYHIFLSAALDKQRVTL